MGDETVVTAGGQPIIIPFGIGAIKVSRVMLHGIPMYGICPQPRELWGTPGEANDEWAPGQPKEQIPEIFVALAFQNKESVRRMIVELQSIAEFTDWSAVPNLREKPE